MRESRVSGLQSCQPTAPLPDRADRAHVGLFSASYGKSHSIVEVERYTRIYDNICM